MSDGQGTRAEKHGKQSDLAADEPGVAHDRRPLDQYRVRSVDRAVDVLMSFTADRPTLSLGEIASITGLTKPTVFRILASLRARDLVRATPDAGHYCLGYGVLALAAITRVQPVLTEAAAPYMRRLRDETAETVVLSVRDGDSRVHLVQFESPEQTRRVVSIGERVPLYVGAAGRVFLADDDDEALSAYLSRTDLKELGPETITAADDLRTRIDQVRKRGYDTGNRERTPDGGGIAAGVRDHTGAVTATLHIICPSSRFTKQMHDQCVPLLLSATRLLSKELGASELEEDG